MLGHDAEGRINPMNVGKDSDLHLPLQPRSLITSLAIY
jgi:hypothetical protein